MIILPVIENLLKQLEGSKSKVLGIIHDDVIIEIHKDEEYLIDEIQHKISMFNFENTGHNQYIKERVVTYVQPC